MTKYKKINKLITNDTLNNSTQDLPLCNNIIGAITNNCLLNISRYDYAKNILYAMLLNKIELQKLNFYQRKEFLDFLESKSLEEKNYLLNFINTLSQTQLLQQLFSSGNLNETFINNIPKQISENNSAIIDIQKVLKECLSEANE